LGPHEHAERDDRISSIGRQLREKPLARRERPRARGVAASDLAVIACVGDTLRIYLRVSITSLGQRLGIG
jgi:hypothetical protein